MAHLCDLSSPSARLRDALDILAARWTDTRDGWDDANSRNLEESHLRPLGNDAMAALAAASHLADVIDSAQRECENEREN